MKIWANTIVHNEDKFIWFSVMSVIEYVDKMLIFDTGSSDKTVEIIKDIIKNNPNKIIFKEVGEVNDYEFTKMRQQMLDDSKCDWILILDGDEIWWQESLDKVLNLVATEGENVEGIVVPVYTSIGDVYHYQEDEAGQYQILGQKGHFNLKFISTKIPGLHLELPYGKEGYFDENNQPVQTRAKIKLVDAPYLHTTHLKRSSQKKRYDKFKYELGHSLPSKLKLPEVFSKTRPIIVASPLNRRSKGYIIRAALETVPKKIKRKVGSFI